MEQNKVLDKLEPKLTEEQKKQKAEIEAARAEMQKRLNEPIDADEAAKALAEADIQRCQLRAYINSLRNQIAVAEAQILEIDCSDAVTRRRMLNKKA